jgi:2-succinyl-5-enolpyruvyl-6-hydroxy-3-cyclohexene-1-carboxylate synthase
VLGAATVPGGGPIVALCGDLTFLHDSNGLLAAARRGLDATFVVIDNRGGGIFNFLPQSALAGNQFEALFATPQDVDLAELAAVHRVPAEQVGKADDLVPAVERALAAGGVRLVVVTTDRADNVARHRQVWEAVAMPGGGGG